MQRGRGGADGVGGGDPFSTNPDPGLTDVRYGSSNGGDDNTGDGDVKKEKAGDGDDDEAAAAQAGE